MTVMIILLKFKMDLKMYVQVAIYLLETYTSQTLPRYSNSQLFTILIDQNIYNETIFSINSMFKIIHIVC